MKRSIAFVSLVSVAIALFGCGGGSSNGVMNPGAGANNSPGTEQIQQFGSLVTRIAGTIQPPVTGGGSGVVVTGVAGATVSSMVARTTLPVLANTRIAFRSNRTSNFDIWIMNSDGSNLLNLTDGTGFNQSPALSPDGTRIAFESDRSGNNDIWVVNTDGTNPTNLTNNANPNFSGNPSWSPEGTKLAFFNSDGSATNIQTMNTNGTGVQKITNTSGINDTPSWNGGRLRTLIGPGAPLGTAAAGFLFGQQGKKVTSVLAFDTPNTLAAPRTNARVSAQTGLTPGLPNVLFTLSADSLASLSYVNGLSAPVTTVPLAGGVTGAVVSFDASDGTIASVLPYAANRVASGAKLDTIVGGIHMLHAHFTGVWDGSGHNRAPSGASEVGIDAKTGALLSVK
jgi:dipeptidyl aminopeptidase/acylaminoacyl peptidase